MITVVLTSSVPYCERDRYLQAYWIQSATTSKKYAASSSATRGVRNKDVRNILQAICSADRIILFLPLLHMYASIRINERVMLNRCINKKIAQFATKGQDFFTRSVFR